MLHYEDIFTLRTLTEVAAAASQRQGCASFFSYPKFVTGGRKRLCPLITQLKWTGSVELPLTLYLYLYHLLLLVLHIIYIYISLCLSLVYRIYSGKHHQRS